MRSGSGSSRTGEFRLPYAIDPPALNLEVWMRFINPAAALSLLESLLAADTTVATEHVGMFEVARGNEAPGAYNPVAAGLVQRLADGLCDASVADVQGLREFLQQAASSDAQVS